MIRVLLWIGGSLIGWAVITLPATIAVLRAMRALDRASKPQPQPDDTWLDDLPINCLSPAEIERRFARITSGEVWS